MLGLVTGGTGHIGTVLLQKLLINGFNVRALIRETSVTDFIPDKFETVIGDVTEFDSLLKAVEDCDFIFHLAGVLPESGGKKKMEEVNVEGVKNICEAAEKKDVKKLVHTSSITTIGCHPDKKLVSERHKFANSIDKTEYSKTKYKGERIALSFADRMDVTIVNPTFVFGPFDFKKSREHLFNKVKDSDVVFSPPGGINVVDVEDVAIGHIKALKRGGKGERYILGGHNVTFRGLYRAIGKVIGNLPPVISPPKKVYKTAGHFVISLYEMVGFEPPKTRRLINLSSEKYFVKIEKARKELNYSPSPLRKTLIRTWKWYNREHDFGDNFLCLC